MKFRESERIGQVLERLYGWNVSPLRKIIRWVVFRRRHAQFYSKTLRSLFEKYHGVSVGLYSYGVFGPNIPPGTRIGRYTSVAKGLTVINGSHPVDWQSTHPFFYNPDFGYVRDLMIKRRDRLIIGNDVYIGQNVTLLPRVEHIGDGAVIAAGSVVVKDVPAFSIVGGNPAKVIRSRFSPQLAEEVSKSQWWSRDISELSTPENFPRFLKPLGN